MMPRMLDLLLLFGDDIRRTWKQVTQFDAELLPSLSETAPMPSAPELPLPRVALEDGATLVRDERGVRLARETDD